jgi:hypothetical protein
MPPNGFIRNCGCQVGLANAIIAKQDQPTLRAAGIFNCPNVGTPNPRYIWVEILEGLVAEWVEIAHRE